MPLLKLLQPPWNRRKLKPLFLPFQLSPLLYPLRLLAARLRRPLLRHRLAAWSCRRPALDRFTRHPSCHPLNLVRATLLPGLESSVASRSSTAAPRVAPAAIRNVPPVALQLPASSLADPAPSIRPALPWVALLAPALQAHGPVSEPVQALADHLVPASVLVRAQAELHQPARHPVRSALLLVDAAGVRSTPRPRKAQ